MKKFHLNHYERAFGNWLIDNSIFYLAVDEKKRAALGRANIKSFDYLLSVDGKQIITEVKGRKFRGTSFAHLTGFDCWVSADDIDSLTAWQKIFGPEHIAVFIFAYVMENVDVDYDGREIYEFQGRNYAFFAIELNDYRSFMKVRSPKWKTVTLPANKFRQCAVEISESLG